MAWTGAGSCRPAFTKSSDAFARLLADNLFPRTEAEFPSQIADPHAASHLVLKIQVVQDEAFKEVKPKLSLLADGYCSGIRSGIPGEGLRTARTSEVVKGQRQRLGKL